MRWVVPALVWLAACGRIDFNATSTSTSCSTNACDSGFACASDLLCHPILFQDGFAGSQINADWALMRFEFAQQSGELATTPTVRPGFNYGQFGNGRSGVAALHIGDTTWTDVRVAWTQQSLASLHIVDSSLPACQHTPSVMFRVESYAESWNAPQDTDYSWSIDQGCVGPVGPTGTWGLESAIGVWIPGQGWSATHDGTSYPLATGLDTSIVDGPVQYVIEVVGPHISIWTDDVLAVDYTDTNTYASGQAPPSYGGVGFSSAWEQMFWISDVTVADLTR